MYNLDLTNNNNNNNNNIKHDMIIKGRLSGGGKWHKREGDQKGEDNGW
jgi:hypothetical protein